MRPRMRDADDRLVGARLAAARPATMCTSGRKRITSSGTPRMDDVGHPVRAELLHGADDDDLGRAEGLPALVRLHAGRGEDERNARLLDDAPELGVAAHAQDDGVLGLAGGRPASS